VPERIDHQPRHHDIHANPENAADDIADLRLRVGGFAVEQSHDFLHRPHQSAASDHRPVHFALDTDNLKVVLSFADAAVSLPLPEYGLERARLGR
jgi:hypothetical protein